MDPLLINLAILGAMIPGFILLGALLAAWERPNWPAEPPSAPPPPAAE